MFSSICYDKWYAVLKFEKKISIKTIYNKYIFRIVTALVFWGIVYGIVSLMGDSAITNYKITIHQIVHIPEKIIFGPPWFLYWYLYLIIGLYILTPLLRIFVAGCEKKRCIRKKSPLKLFTWFVSDGNTDETHASV